MIDERLCRMEVRGHMEPHVVDAHRPKTLSVYVVMGDSDHAGCVKPITLHSGLSCPFLEATWATRQNGDKVLKEIRIPFEYAKRGWFLLERAYEVEGNTHGLEQWRAFQKACKGRRAFHEKDDPRIVPGFPDELLPKAVRDVVAKRDPRLDAWTPEMPAESKRVRPQASASA